MHEGGLSRRCLPGFNPNGRSDRTRFRQHSVSQTSGESFRGSGEKQSQMEFLNRGAGLSPGGQPRQDCSPAAQLTCRVCLEQFPAGNSRTRQPSFEALPFRSQNANRIDNHRQLQCGGVAGRLSGFAVSADLPGLNDLASR